MLVNKSNVFLGFLKVLKSNCIHAFEDMFYAGLKGKQRSLKYFQVQIHFVTLIHTVIFTQLNIIMCPWPVEQDEG